ncbi:Membrane-associated zinc metalloprotease [Clostridiaceae bacterium JG1575]|nr:Membrane-associated zinc metalloprotease [Clostridiaceae bacterium JG1575]
MGGERSSFVTTERCKIRYNEYELMPERAGPNLGSLERCRNKTGYEKEKKMSIVIAILGFGFLVLIHEYGHFIVARLNGVHVEEFSLGMGPTLWSKKGKKGTVWSLKALPIGGMCQMKGEDTGEVDVSSDSFQSKKPLQRMSIIFAGPLMNLLVGFVFFALLARGTGFQTNQAATILPDSPAQAAGMVAGDEIEAINGKKVTTFMDVVTYTALAEGKPMQVTLRRGAERLQKEITAKKTQTGQYLIGFRPVQELHPGPIVSVRQGFKEAGSMVRQTYQSLGLLVTGKVGLNQMGGPVAILGLASNVAKTSLLGFFRFLGFISINLAIFNLLPFPALDGGWLLVLLVEWISRRKLPEKFMTAWNGIGFAILMIFMVLITFKDLLFPLRL